MNINNEIEGNYNFQGNTIYFENYKLLEKIHYLEIELEMVKAEMLLMRKVFVRVLKKKKPVV